MTRELFKLATMVGFFFSLKYFFDLEFGSMDEQLFFNAILISVMASILIFIQNTSMFIKTILSLALVLQILVVENAYERKALTYNGLLFNPKTIHERYVLTSTNRVYDFSDVTNPYSIKHIDEVIQRSNTVLDEYYAQKLLDSLRTREPTEFELIALKHIPKKFYKLEYLREDKTEVPATVLIKKDLSKYYEQN